MHQRNLLIFSVLTVLSTGSCTCKKVDGLEPVSVGNPDLKDASVAGGTVEAHIPAPERTTSTTSSVVADRHYSAACPESMREVAGDYCASVEHRCLVGRDTVFTPDPNHPGGLYVQKTVPWSCTKPEGCAVPNYCDKFVKGYAVCGLKADGTPDKTKKHFCIDDGEYPNVAGEMPRVFVTWNEANDLCKAQNKRLCDNDEWTLACEGNEHLPYSYGWERDTSRCYIDHQKPEGPQPVLSSPNCTSPFGVHDMTGNVDEWTRNVTEKGKFPSMFKGGHWVELARNRCRPATTSHGPTFSFYAEGFRCCADAKQPATR